MTVIPAHAKLYSRNAVVESWSKEDSRVSAIAIITPTIAAATWMETPSEAVPRIRFEPIIREAKDENLPIQTREELWRGT